MDLRSIAPVSFDFVPRVGRHEARLLGRAPELLDGLAPSLLASRAGSLLGGRAALALGGLGVAGDRELASFLAPVVAAVLLERSRGRAAIEISTELAFRAVDRVLGGSGDDERASMPAPMPLDDVEQGVLAFAAARVVEGSAWRVVGVATTREGLAAFLTGASAAFGFDVAIEPEEGASLVRGAGRLWVPLRTLFALDASSATHATTGAAIPLEAWPRLAELPRVVGVRVGRAALRADELASLALGDVIVPDELTCRPLRGAAERVVGEAALTIGAHVIADARLADDGALVLHALRLDSLPRPATAASVLPTLEAPMTHDADPTTSSLAAASRDADDAPRADVSALPIELAIELGRLEVRVGELARWTPGQVLTTGIALGASVLLRAGDRVVAHGELVDVEGELGVRLTKLG